jgi:hypothetical protein
MRGENNHSKIINSKKRKKKEIPQKNQTKTTTRENGKL